MMRRNIALGAALLILLGAAVVWSGWDSSTANAASPAATATSRSGQTLPPPQPPPTYIYQTNRTCPASALTPPTPMVIERLPNTLKLTTEQTEKLKTILTESENKLKPLRNAVIVQTTQLRERVTLGQSDSKNAQELAAKALEAEKAVLDAEVDTWVQIKSVLSMDQMRILRQINDRMTSPQTQPGQMMPGPSVPPPNVDH